MWKVSLAMSGVGVDVPVQNIKWKHGETINDMVKDVMERKTDANGFKTAWSERCGTIGYQLMPFSRDTGTQI